MASAIGTGILIFFMSVLFVLLLLIIIGFVFLNRLREQVRKMFGGQAYTQQSPRERAYRNRHREGEVRVHTTPGAPGKRVSDDVGDYVEFEETSGKK